MFTKEFYVTCQEEAEKLNHPLTYVIRERMLKRSTRLIKATHEEVEATVTKMIEQDKGIIESLLERDTSE